MSDYVFIVYLKNNVIAVYNNEILLNTFIDGAVQKNFFKKEEIKIEKYTMNSMLCITKKEEIIIPKKEKIDIPKKEVNMEPKKLQEYLNSDEYKKLAQERTDTKHEINILKLKKKKYEEEKQVFESDLKIYYQFKKAKEQDNFEMPDMFIIKYDIFKKLEENNQLTFELFKEEWDKVKPKNNYNLFNANSYEETFTNKQSELNVEFNI